jgi:hypothetical protein
MRSTKLFQTKDSFIKTEAPIPFSKDEIESFKEEALEAMEDTVVFEWDQVVNEIYNENLQ